MSRRLSCIHLLVRSSVIIGKGLFFIILTIRSLLSVYRYPFSCRGFQLVTVEKGIHREPDKKRKITDEEHKRLKKKKQLKKMREQREKKGMVLLPEKIERKIYRMKKAMRAKDKTSQEIREEIRRFRRKEELAYRKLCLKVHTSSWTNIYCIS